MLRGPRSGALGWPKVAPMMPKDAAAMSSSCDWQRHLWRANRHKRCKNETTLPAGEVRQNCTRPLGRLKCQTICLTFRYVNCSLKGVGQTNCLTQLEALPLQRVGQPQDMGNAIFYLLTAPFVTGVVLDVDGGHGIRQYANPTNDPMQRNKK